MSVLSQAPVDRATLDDAQEALLEAQELLAEERRANAELRERLGEAPPAIAESFGGRLVIHRLQTGAIVAAVSPGIAETAA